MKKIYLLILVCFVLFYSNTYAILKFDLGISAGVGKLEGLTDPAPNPEALSLKLKATLWSIGINLDFVNVMSWNQPYYGMGFGLYAGASFYNQWFANSMMTNGQVTNFIVTNAQMLSIMVLDIVPMYKFFPTREVSIGIGPIVSLILNKGNPKFLDSAYYAAFTNATPGAYISPLFGDNIALGLMIDASIAKYWGNFGLYFGINLRVPFAPMSVGIEGKGGVKFRFNT